jgi:hypothetical protein
MIFRKKKNVFPAFKDRKHFTSEFYNTSSGDKLKSTEDKSSQNANRLGVFLTYLLFFFIFYHCVILDIIENFSVFYELITADTFIAVAKTLDRINTSPSSEVEIFRKLRSLYPELYTVTQYIEFFFKD